MHTYIKYLAILSFALIFSACQTSSNQEGENTENDPTADCSFSMQTIQQNPGGEYTAVAGLKICEGKEQTTYTEVSVYKKNENITGKPSNVMKVKGDVIIDVAWEGNTLKVSHNADANDIELKESSVYDNISVSYSPLQ